MEPLRAEWATVQARVAALAETDAPAALSASLCEFKFWSCVETRV